MSQKISAIINTLNEEKNITRVLKSVQFCNEVIVCDMQSDDDTAVIAKRMGATIILHKRMGYVEPARNFAISKASGEWILIVDADEEIPETLAVKLRALADEENSVLTHVEIPRQNMIFGKWIKNSMWWPDYNIRFFRSGKVTWSDAIHSRPQAEGQGLKLPEEEKFAIIHHHYVNLTQFIERMNRYTTIQAQGLIKDGYKFQWRDVITKPLGEFLSRYFAHRGFDDGLHGLALSLLQAFSFVVMYLKVWEAEGFQKREVSLSEVRDTAQEAGKELTYWFKYGNLSKNALKNFLQRAKNKIS